MDPTKVKSTDQIWKDFKEFYEAEYDEVPHIKAMKDYCSDEYYEFIGYLRDLKREEEYKQSQKENDERIAAIRNKRKGE